MTLEQSPAALRHRPAKPPAQLGISAQIYGGSGFGRRSRQHGSHSVENIHKHYFFFFNNNYYYCYYYYYHYYDDHYCYYYPNLYYCHTTTTTTNFCTDCKLLACVLPSVCSVASSRILARMHFASVLASTHANAMTLARVCFYNGDVGLEYMGLELIVKFQAIFFDGLF